jgi:hypothetical protein
MDEWDEYCSWESEYFDAACDAEQEIVEHFVTHVELPSKKDCEDIITQDEHGTEIVAEFGARQYEAVKGMWTNRFEEETVCEYSTIGDTYCKTMVMYAINRIFQRLVEDNPSWVLEKIVGGEEIQGAPVLCVVSKTHVQPFWISSPRD